jgi:uncharacterized protein (TIGR02466 family)
MPPATGLHRLFVTPVYHAALPGRLAARLNPELEAASRATAEDDRAGQRWCRRHGYAGYTSHASLDDLPWRYPAFARLVKELDRHAARFARQLAFDLGDRPLALDSLWINVLPPGGFHSGHIHPHSVISGTYYVALPPGAAALRFEDPRSSGFMAAPPRKTTAPEELRPFVTLKARPGELLLWESWLRHEVPLNGGNEERISISFNYRRDDTLPARTGAGRR